MEGVQRLKDTQHDQSFEKPSAACPAENTPVISPPSESNFQHGAWSFTSVSGSISGREQLARIQECLPSAQTLPEMLFGSNYLCIKHMETGTEVCHFP